MHAGKVLTIVCFCKVDTSFRMNASTIEASILPLLSHFSKEPLDTSRLDSTNGPAQDQRSRVENHMGGAKSNAASD